LPPELAYRSARKEADFGSSAGEFRDQSNRDFFVPFREFSEAFPPDQGKWVLPATRQGNPDAARLSPPYH
jgi:hypothetical protein